MLTIGEFSRRGGVSPRMLRHYDKVRLLSPAYVGENGYRYYDEAQLPVLAQIETLKGYGFALNEVGALLRLPEGALAQRIHTRRLAAFRELDGLRRTIRRMEEYLLKMEGNGMENNQKYHVILMEAPAQKVFGLRKTINIAETHALFRALYEEMGRRGLQRAGAAQLLYHGKAFSYESMDVEAQAVVAQDGEGVRTLPAGTFAAVTHIGPYEEIHFAYKALGAWMAAHPEYESCGSAIERYLKDEGEAQDPEGLETGVLFPVRKKA